MDSAAKVRIKSETTKQLTKFTIMAKKTYKWLERMVDKITKADCPNNNYFRYYGREVTLQSGTRDYVDVHVAERDDGGWLRNQICFTFDFWTKDLCFCSYNSYEERDAIIKAFRKIYGSVSVESDEPWEDDIRPYQQMLGNDEYDQESVEREYNELMKLKAA